MVMPDLKLSFKLQANNESTKVLASAQYASFVVSTKLICIVVYYVNHVNEYT